MAATLREVAHGVLQDLLGVFGLQKDDYSVEVKEDEKNLAFHVEIGDGENEDDRAAVLIGKSGRTLACLQTIFFAAVGYEINSPVPKGLWLAINGRRPDLRIFHNGHNDHGERDDKAGSVAVPAIVQGGHVTTKWSGRRKVYSGLFG